MGLAFHFNVENRHLYACRALKKAQRLQMSAAVLFDRQDDLNSFDRTLWCFDQGSFIPHARLGSKDLKHGAFALAMDGESVPKVDLLILLTHDAPGNISDLVGAFDKIIDIVPREGDEYLEGRKRYVAYKKAGIEPKAYDRASAEQAS